MKIPKKIKKWADKQPEPAFAYTCWFITTPEWKKIVKEKLKNTKP